MILAIYCAGGFGREIIGLARAVNRWERIVYVDDVTPEKTVADTPVYRFEEVGALGGAVEFVIASGEPAGRAKLYDKIKAAGYPLATLVSPWASVGDRTTIGEGSILCDCTLTVDIQVGVNVLINGRAIAGHDVIFGAHSVVSPNVFLGGHTILGEQVYLAPGAMVKDRITIGKSAIVSLGAVILRNVKPKSIMVGNPAKKIGENTEGKVFGMFDQRDLL